MNPAILSVLFLALSCDLVESIFPYSFYQSALMSLDLRLLTYDKRIRPGLETEDFPPAVTVNVTAFVLKLFDYNNERNSIRMSFFYREQWVDGRLTFDGNDTDIKQIVLKQDTLDKIWTPDTFFTNSFDNTIHHNQPNPTTFLKMSSEGEVFYSKKLTTDVGCHPLKVKHQLPIVCSFEIESYGTSTKDIVYKWKRVNGTFSDAVGIESVAVTALKDKDRLKYVSHKLEEKETQLNSGNYSRLVLSITLDEDK